MQDASGMAHSRDRPKGRSVTSVFRSLACLLACALCILLAAPGAAEERAFAWPVTPASEVGFDGAMPDQLTRELSEKLPRVLSFGVVRRGKLVYEYYRSGKGAELATTPESLVNVASVTKSVLSLLVMIALDQGVFRGLDQPMSDFFPELLAPGLDLRARSITLAHMLGMTTGWESNRMDIPPFLPLDALKRPFAFSPGEKFQYDNATSHLLSIALARAAGMPVEAFAEKHLFGPLEIRTYAWGRDSQGQVNGWHMLQVTLRDMLKIGQLVLDKGAWRGKQIITEARIAAMVTPGTVGGLASGLPYAQQWSVFTTTALGASHTGYAAIGYGGQIIYVVPALDLVIAKTQTRDQREGDNAFIREIVMTSLR